MKVIKFHSLVNDVSRMETVGGAFVRKIYTNVARGTGIPVPAARKEIEARVLRILSNAGYRNFHTPKLLNEGKDYIDIEYIEGFRAIDCAPHSLTSSSIPHWIFLGASLARAERLLSINAADVFDGLDNVQLECATAIYRLKTPGFEYKTQHHNSVSLGDVSLSNLIITPSAIFLLDFEFCHRARAGRDAGQLISQLLSAGQMKLAQCVEEGYLGNSGIEHDLSQWISAFKGYYAMKINGKA